MGACNQFSQNQSYDAVKLTIDRETIIKASNLPSNSYSLPLSNFDRLLNGFPVCIVHVYPKPTKGDRDLISHTIKSSLSKTLTHFPPFAGQIITNHADQTEILCNNRGVKLAEASVDLSLSDLDLHNQTNTIHLLTKFPRNHRDFIVNVQITSFRCGGFSMSWIFDHVLADANAFAKFLSTWCEIARTNKSSTMFTFDRSVFKPRSPLKFDRQLIEQNYTACNSNDIIKTPRDCDRATEQRLYLVRGSTLERLKASCKKSRTVALSAYLWKVMGKALSKDKDSKTRCRMAWPVDGRRRVGKEFDNYIGNVVLVGNGECSVGDLKEGSLEWIADIASEAISKVANREYFMDTIDWVESNSGKVLWHNIVMGDDMPSVVVSSCHEMKVMDVDFGFGSPEVGMISLLGLSIGYVNIMSSGRGDGSWLVSAVVSPSFAKELDSDPDHVFVPITNLRC